MYRNKVAPRQEVVKSDVLCKLLLFLVPAVIQHLHPKPICAAGNSRSYPSKADYAKRRAVHLLTQEQVGCPADLPFSLPYHPVTLNDVAGTREYERKREVCGCLG